MQLESDRRYRFPVPPDRFWSALGDVSRWSHWWPWLRDVDGDGLADGTSVRGRIRPPLPYTLDVTIRVVDDGSPAWMAVVVEGDIAGTARVDVREVAGGCEVRLTAVLRPRRPDLRLFAAIVPGVVRRGHDWVLDTGAQQFRSRAL